MSLAKKIGARIPTYNIIFFRCLFSFLALLPFAAWKLKKAGRREFQITQRWLYVVRVTLITCAMGCTYYAYRHLPLATASAIGFSSPLFTSILDKLILKNKIGFQHWLIIILGYIGIIIIIQPTFFELKIPTMIAILANLLTSASIIVLKNLSRTESDISIIFYTNFSTLILSIFIILKNFQIPSIQDLYSLVYIGISATFSQYFYIQALRIAEPYFIAPFEYNRFFFAIISGYIFFDEIPLLSLLVGTCMIAITNYYLVITAGKQVN